MLPFRIHPEAEAEAFKAAEYIKSDDFQEGEQFVKAFEQALIQARSQPLIYNCFDGDFRKVRLGKFRYLLIFRVRDGEVQVMTVMHTSRQPRYWKRRGF